MRGLWAVVICMMAGCSSPEPPVVVPAAFRWKNDRNLSETEREVVIGDSIQRVYHKLLDIGWNPANGAHPVSVVPVPYEWRNYRRVEGEWTSYVELVPCIYIANNTFLQIDDDEADRLAANLLRKLRMECPATIHGVMLDCDWTDRTKDRFFRLTRIMNDSLDVPLTATIRLHQYAHPGKTGVPPADRGMLMPYNIGKVDKPGPVNSIFDCDAAAPYFRRKGYPLPLDIALPAFSWGAQFRKGRFIGLLQEDLLDDALQRGLLTGERYGLMQVTREDNEHRPELHLGDEVRVERMTPELIRQAAELARTAVHSGAVAVTFFELGSPTFQRLPPTFLDSTFRAFGTIRPPLIITPLP